MSFRCFRRYVVQLRCPIRKESRWNSLSQSRKLLQCGMWDLGVEAVYSVLALHHQKSPPTINIFEQDIEGGCDLDYCANEARDLTIRAAISNSFGFGGTNDTLAFKRFTG